MIAKRQSMMAYPGGSAPKYPVTRPRAGSGAIT